MRYLKHIEPHLRDLNPHIAFDFNIFVVCNIILGTALFFQKAHTNDFFIINDFLTYQFWGAMFFLGGIALAVTKNRSLWEGMKISLLFCLALKLFWSLALIARQFTAPGNNAILLIIICTLGALQVGDYIFFPDYKRFTPWKQAK